MEKDNIEVLLEKIPRNGMSKGCQKIFPHIARHYFNPESRLTSYDGSFDELKSGLKKKNQGYAEEIYKRLESVKLNSLKTASQVMNGRHPRDLAEDYVFAETIMRYCVSFTNKKKGLTKNLQVVLELHKNF